MKRKKPLSYEKQGAEAQREKKAVSTAGRGDMGHFEQKQNTALKHRELRKENKGS
jgi:hypothetical protein